MSDYGGEDRSVPTEVLATLPDFQEPDKEVEPPPDNIDPSYGVSYGEEGTEGSFTKGAADAAQGPDRECGLGSAIDGGDYWIEEDTEGSFATFSDGPELTCGSDPAIEAVLHAEK